MKYKNIREEELKNIITKDFFKHFDCTSILRNVDFAVAKQPNLTYKKLLTPTQHATASCLQDGIFTNEYYIWA